MEDVYGGTGPSGDHSSTSQNKKADPPQSSNSGAYDNHEARGGSQFGTSQSSSSHGSYPYMNYQPQHHAHQARQEPFNMNPLGNALQDMSYQNHGVLNPQRFSGSSPSSLGYHPQNVPQFAASSPVGQSASNIPYSYPYQPQYQGSFLPAHSTSQHFQTGVGASTQFYQGHGYMGQPQQPGSSFSMQPNQYVSQNSTYLAGSAAVQSGGRGGLSIQQREAEYPSPISGIGQGRPSSIASSSGQSSVVRGPPRKPRQSGHAIWIGNLPPQTELMSLVLHVCKETLGLESLFLISKSNCAFANFKDEAACVAAQAKIHDSRFQSVKLVSRLRRSSVGGAAGVSAPTGPAALSPPSNPVVARTPSPEDEEDTREEGTVDNSQEGQDESLPKNKFFVVKSLTVEDLEMSVRNGIWATQSHNEDALNKAYQTADNVYLVFSANKSGEYFGYARMASPINDDPAAAIEFAPKAQTVEDMDAPKAISTPATGFAPKGRIIDDSARGTIFWEAERDDANETADEEEESHSNRSDQDESLPSSKAWGKPFQVEWISTNRVPFYRTRGLRNPWNSNREVKIARDGTELETSTGRRLLGLFHRMPGPVAPPNIPGMPLQLMGASYATHETIPINWNPSRC